VDSSGQKHQVLQTLVELTDETGRPVSASRVAESIGCDPAAVQTTLDVLCSYEFVRTPGDGRYEPTITGREFLALDIDEESFVVVDTTGNRSES
jgi:predicted transcriptional regulator